MRIRNLPGQSPNNSVLLSTDSDGNIGRSLAYQLLDVDSQIANRNVDRTLRNAQTINDIDLELLTTVVILANKDARIIITYTVPVGIGNFKTPVGYYGIRFLKDAFEAPAGSRKFSINSSQSSTLITTNMATISATYTESFISLPTVRTYVYSLNGYIEQIANSTNDIIYRFNMWSPTGDNFNWGRATITKKVFIK